LAFRRFAPYLSSMSDSPPIGAIVVPVTPFQQNCTLVWCTRTKQAAFIDPGGEVDGLIELVKSRGLELAKIWVTHGHLDHCGGAAELREKTGLSIEGPHPDDRFWIEGIETSAPQWGMSGARSFEPERWLAEGDTMELGETTFEVIHCPGHTPGHVIFFHRQARFAQVGDVLFRGSIGRTDFPRGNYEQLISSITGKLWPLGDDVRFMPGHGPTSSFGEERRSNPFVADAVLAGAGA
jgi:glyoxylase-like metal-dependent hydrolase (beta-lactamase superfamily II)